MNRLIAATVVCVLAACGTPTDANKDGIADGVVTPRDTTVVAPSTPIGTVSGVIATTKYAGLEGAAVTLVLGGKGEGTSTTFSAITDVFGTFSFKGLPGGASGQLLVTKTGFATARASVQVPASAGNFLINDGNGNVGVLLLTELNATLKYFVYGSNGRPAKGVKATLDVAPAAMIANSSSAYGSGHGAISVEATADELGVLSFANVPNPVELARLTSAIAYNLFVSAWDEDGDGRYESLGTVSQLSGSSLLTNPVQVITLPDARSSQGLAILSSNLDSFTNLGASTPPYRNDLRGSDPISVVFNQPIGDKTLLSVKVVAEDCATNVPVKVEQKAANLLTISPATTWGVGNEYHVAIRATGLDRGTTTSFIGYFYAIDASAPRALASVSFQAKKGPGNTDLTTMQAGDDLFVTFDSPTTDLGANPRVQVNKDLNANGTIGGPNDQSVGEYGSPFASGYGISSYEPSYAPDLTTFSCRTTGYASRWRVVGLTPPAAGLPTGTPLKVIVPKDTSSSSGFQTAWGQVFTGDLAGTLSVVP
jgi:hypothetical protein